MAIKAQYTVKQNDRISRIAANYQVTSQDIINANANIFTPERNRMTDQLRAASVLNPGEVLIYAGEILNIPDGTFDQLAEIQTINADAEDELTIYIDGAKVPLPHEFEFTEFFDSCSDSFSITYPHDEALTKPLFKVDPSEFVEKGLPDIKIFMGKGAALNGSIEVPAFRLTGNSSVQTLGGRSKTFLLEKSDMLPSIQREFIKLDLKQIADIVCAGYGLQATVQTGLSVGSPFPKATVDDNETPFNFLARLARERGLLIGKTSDGKVLIMKAVDAEAVAYFDIDTQFLSFLGVEALEIAYDTTQLFGQYIGKATTAEDTNITATAASALIAQQSCKIIKFQDGTKANIDQLTAWEEQKASREFYKNVIPYPSWLNPNSGKRWKAGEFILIRCAATMMSEPMDMMIKSVKFTDTGSRKTAELEIVPKSTYLDIPLVINNKKKKGKESVIDRLGLR
jgi:prophage tail gpP-like protein